MSQRRFDTSGITEELTSLNLNSSLPSTSDNANLFCYNSKGNITQCRPLGQSGSCLISYEIKGNLIDRSCITETTLKSFFGSIRQSNKHATSELSVNNRYVIIIQH